MKSCAWRGFCLYLCVAKTSRGTAEEPRGFDFFFFSFPSKVVDLTLRNVSQECLQRQIAFCFLHYRQMWDVSAQARCCCCCWSFSHRGVMRSLGPLTTAQQQLSRIDICGSWYVPALLFSTRFCYSSFTHSFVCNWNSTGTTVICVCPEHPSSILQFFFTFTKHVDSP